MTHGLNQLLWWKMGLGGLEEICKCSRGECFVSLGFSGLYWGAPEMGENKYFVRGREESSRKPRGFGCT